MRSKPAQQKFTTATANYTNAEAAMDGDDESNGWQDEVIAALVKQGLANDPMFLDKTILEAMHPKARHAFLMLRREVAQLKGSTTPKTGNVQVKEEPTSTPKQYSSSKQDTRTKPTMTTAKATVDTSSEDNDENYENDKDDEECMGMLTQAHAHPYFGGVVMMMEDKQQNDNNVYTPLFDMHANAVHGATDSYAICNNGAQICILGGLTGE
jgi:hypothetical protein